MDNAPIVIVGFGSQAKAWALNLKDSKRNFVIALSKFSKSHELVSSMGMNSISLEDNNLQNYSTFILLIPDDQHKSFFEKNLSYFTANSHFIYAHGFSLTRERFTEKMPQFTHSLLAPKAIASEVRFQYETKGKIGAIYYSNQIEKYNFLFGIAKDAGFTALYPAHFEEETVADLFSEQTLLCSLLPYASLKAFNKLIENNIPKELAFMECFLELKSISQALVTMGPEDFFKLISPNALIGSEVGQKKLLDQHFDEALNEIFIDIQSKQFYNLVENDKGKIRQIVLDRWKNEELNKTFKQLKNELI